MADSLLLDQTEKIQKFIRIINRELDRRKKLLSEHGVGTIALYREVTGKQEPTMVILMDSYESMEDEPYETDLFKLFIRNGFGIFYIITEKWMIFFRCYSSPEAAKKLQQKLLKNCIIAIGSSMH